MTLESFAYLASALSVIVLAFLVLANLVIIVARMTKNEALASKIISGLLPFAELFRVPGKKTDRAGNITSGK